MEQSVIELTGVSHGALRLEYKQDLTYLGITYNSALTAYLAQQCKHREDKVRLATMEAGKAVRVVQNMERVENWGKIKEQVMYAIIDVKFEDTNTIQMLLDTGDNVLEYDSMFVGLVFGSVVDTMFGRRAVGANLIGLYYMEMRYLHRQLNHSLGGIELARV